MFKDFKAFAFKGNLVDMAVGIIIGGAFATVTKSLVANVFMPPLGLLIGGVDFKKMQIVLKEGQAATETTKAIEPITINYGLFITDLIAFLLLAFVVFLIVKKFMTSLKKEEKKAPEKPAEPSKEETLLTEIRDLLAKKNS